MRLLSFSSCVPFLSALSPSFLFSILFQAICVTSVYDTYGRKMDTAKKPHIRQLDMWLGGEVETEREDTGVIYVWDEGVENEKEQTVKDKV